MDRNGDDWHREQNQPRLRNHLQQQRDNQCFDRELASGWSQVDEESRLPSVACGSLRIGRRSGSAERRNERERRRVEAIGQAFARLRCFLPSDEHDESYCVPPSDTRGRTGSARRKPLSKIDTLWSAVRYIRYLRSLVESDEREADPRRSYFRYHGNEYVHCFGDEYIAGSSDTWFHGYQATPYPGSYPSSPFVCSLTDDTIRCTAPTTRYTQVYTSTISFDRSMHCNSLE